MRNIIVACTAFMRAGQPWQVWFWRHWYIIWRHSLCITSIYTHQCYATKEGALRFSGQSRAIYVGYQFCRMCSSFFACRRIFQYEIIIKSTRHAGQRRAWGDSRLESSPCRFVARSLEHVTSSLLLRRLWKMFCMLTFESMTYWHFVIFAATCWYQHI